MDYFQPLERPTSFRKLAASMWRPPNDPHIYGQVDVDATNALAFVDDYNKNNDCKITITHVVVRALAIAFRRHPEANAKVTATRFLQRKRVEIFCQVATGGGRDLSGYKISDVDKKSLQEISAALTRGATDIREDKDPSFKRSRNMFHILPLFALRFVLWVMSFLQNTLHLHLPSLGMPIDAFGAAMVTNVGPFGVDTAWAPLVPIARCSLLILVPQIKQRPWVVDGRVEPRPILRLCASFDHRIIDGYLAGKLNKVVEEVLGNPELLLTEAERGGADAGGESSES